MRIPFPHRAPADSCLRVCKRLLSETVHTQPGKRLPKERVRNALSQGLGYRSYDELIRCVGQADGLVQPPPASDLRQALVIGFSLALAVAHASGFIFNGQIVELADRLAAEAVQLLDRKSEP